MNNTDNLIHPHGGTLVNLMVSDKNSLQKQLDAASELRKLKLSTLEFSDLIMIGIGAFSPLQGFMNQADYKNVLSDMRLTNGILWPVPITLSVESKDIYKQGEIIALLSPYDDEIMGIIEIEDIYSYDKEKEAEKVFGTLDASHPGVKKLNEKGKYYIGGEVKVFSEGGYPQIFPEYARPAKTREIFASKGWKTIVAFQTRNPIHRSHEYLTKVVLENYDGLFIHPIVGKLKEGDIPAEVRMACYKALLDNYYPADRVVLKVYPMEMRYAGPKEAVLHAIIRQNYGCTHIIIGRDHAGVGKFYGPFDAQDVFDTIPDKDLAIRPVKMDWTFYCQKCSSMASYKTCPHSDEDHKLISGTKLREMLSNGEYPPEYITRKEVSEILIDYYKNLDRKDKKKI
ncbi:MAG: sulfate adenylyltransferase [Actinobacteria bacterium]|nr:sulfate adenylyltransferase [Actinomycetota bacterium]